MPLQIIRATEADLPRLLEIQYAAFMASSPVNQLIHPNGLPQSQIENSLVEARRQYHDPRTYFMKVVDTDLISAALGAGTGTKNQSSDANQTAIIAFSRFGVYPNQREPAEWDKPYTESSESIAAGGNREFRNIFLTGLNDLRRKYVKGSPAYGKVNSHSLGG